jgi:hypothetical protein
MDWDREIVPYTRVVTPISTDELNMNINMHAAGSRPKGAAAVNP